MSIFYLDGGGIGGTGAGMDPTNSPYTFYSGTFTGNGTPVQVDIAFGGASTNGDATSVSVDDIFVGVYTPPTPEIDFNSAPRR